jgi:hypothetical protein
MYRGCMTTPTPDPLVVAADALGRPVEVWVRDLRAVGASWDGLAALINEATAGRCRPISREYLRQRFGHIKRFVAS